MPECTYPVVLDVLSQGGAGITLSEPCEFVVCVLRWMDRHAFADVVWREGLSVGVQFDKPIPAEAVEATRLYALQSWTCAPHGDPGVRRC